MRVFFKRKTVGEFVGKPGVADGKDVGPYVNPDTVGPDVVGGKLGHLGHSN